LKVKSACLAIEPGKRFFCFYIEDWVFRTGSEIEGICLGLIGIRKEKRGKRIGQITPLALPERDQWRAGDEHI
jgi:hypothetical protein